jgi:hypothetical protein
MNPVVKALIDELSQTRAEESSSSIPGHDNIIRLTPEQEALSIPPYLVYLAGLLASGEPSISSIASSSGPPYPKLLKERFQEYQTAYHHEGCSSKNSKGGSIMYALSPRLIPTEEQQKCIDQDIERNAKELESAANAVVKGLHEMDDRAEETSSLTRKQQRKPKKKKNLPSSKDAKKSIRHHADTRINIDDGANDVQQNNHKGADDTEEPSETLEQLQLQIQTKNALLQSDDAAGDGAWITVSKKGLSNVSDCEADDSSSPSSERLQETTTTSQSFVETQETFIDTRGQRAPPSGGCESEDASSPARQQLLSFVDDAVEETSNNDAKTLEAEPTPTPTPTATKNNKEESSFALLLLQERNIRLLEQQLAEKEEQLANERRDHATTRRAGKERSDNLAQSLQLRLYISETHLKSYQEALDQHIQAVATNVSAPNNSYNSISSSPMRQGTTSNNEQDHPPPSSPLISRVLQHQNRLHEMGN